MNTRIRKILSPAKQSKIPRWRIRKAVYAVLRDPNNSKAEKVARGSALTMSKDRSVFLNAIKVIDRPEPHP